MSKATARLLLIILILALAILACVGGGDGVITGKGTPSVGNNGALSAQSADATATYGAEQFYIQLTAVARPGP
jgi:flagellar basal body-associated protein FliL